MPATLDDVLKQITGYNDRLQKVEKLLDTSSRARSGRDEQVVKTLLGSRGHTQFGTQIGSGRPSRMIDVADIVDPRRVKSLGEPFAEYLQTLCRVSMPERFHVTDFAAVKKSMDAYQVPVKKAALAEGSGATGGFTMPTQFNNELLMLAAEKSFLRQLVRSLPMTARDLHVPVLDQSQPPPTGGSAFFGGIHWTWQPEGANYLTGAETEPSFRQVGLTARDLVGIVVTSNQLIQDSPLALETILTTLFRDSMAWAYDYFTLQGDGASKPLGMIPSPCAYPISRSVAGHFNLIDGANMYAHMVDSSQSDAIWIAHPGNIPDLITMTNGATNSGFLVWLNPWNPKDDGGPAANKVPAMFMGRPLYFSEKLPAPGSGVLGSVVMVDPNKYLLGDRMAIQIESSIYPKFQSNQTMFRIIARWDGQPELNKPITLADGVYQVSSVVLLQM